MFPSHARPRAAACAMKVRKENITGAAKKFSFSVMSRASLCWNKERKKVDLITAVAMIKKMKMTMPRGRSRESRKRGGAKG